MGTFKDGSTTHRRAILLEECFEVYACLVPGIVVLDVRGKRLQLLLLLPPD